MARMTKPAREELSPFANQIARLRYRAVRHRMGNPEFEIWSFAHITDLRTQANAMRTCKETKKQLSAEAPQSLHGELCVSA